MDINISTTTSTETILGEEIYTFDPVFKLLYIPMVYVPFGIFGNIMTIFIYARKNFTAPVMRYAFSMVAVDLFVNIGQSLYVINYLFVKMYTSYFTPRHAIYYYSGAFFSDSSFYSAYTLVVITVVRCITVVFPLKAKLILSMKFIVSIHALLCLSFWMCQL